MADIPDRIVLKRDRDLEGRRHAVYGRRGGVLLLAAFLVAGLLGVFGQRPGTSLAASPQATLELFAPAHLRGGLLYEARFTIRARRPLKHAVLVLSPGWAESQQINTIEPSPLGETSSDGRLALLLGHIDAGSTYRLFMQFQVNPTNVGRRAADVALYDGSRRLLHLDRTVTVFP
ncbi:MAG TPA: hypothetical protein VFJ91_09075 [Gaiellaceae bacterium]|nr:hypothetical protein [Gaiellaceae bacterium]